MAWENFRVNTRLNHLKFDSMEQVYALISEIDAVKNSWYLTKKLSPKQLLLWQWVAERPNFEFSRKDAVAALGFPERTVESIIKKLVMMQRLQRLGEGPATRYKIVQ